MSDKTYLRLDAVCLEIKRLEDKRKEITEVGKRCEALTETIKKVQQYVAIELSVDSSRKRDRTAADLDDLSKEASAAAEACKKFKGQDARVENPGTSSSKPSFTFVPGASNPSSTPSPRPFGSPFTQTPTTSSTTASTGFSFGMSATPADRP